VSTEPRILFAISDTGGGHRSGAVAIAAAIARLVGDRVSCHIVDLLTSTGLPVVRDAPDLYDQLSTRWLPVFNALFRATDGRRRVDVLSQMVYLGAHRNILRVLEEIRPTLVVSVHPLSNRLIASTRRAYRLSFRFITVVTDLVSLHAAWADPAAELCIVPTDEAHQRQRAAGLAPERLLTTGFPVHPKFTEYAYSQAAARERLGLAAAPFTVLLTSGGVGSGNLGATVRAIAAAAPDVQLLVVTGRNAALRSDLEAAGLGAGVRIYGFVDNMEALMAAADLVVTKAGPGTLMESLVMRRPVLVTQAVGLQEHGNIDFVVGRNLGRFCPGIPQVVEAIAELRQPDAYATSVAALAGAVPRDGAFAIARVLLEQLALDPPELSRPPLLYRVIGARRRSRGEPRPATARPTLGMRLRRIRPFLRWRWRRPPQE
jgi:1,2-diacylglycerol 3-beta-galactosyltransferase